MRIAVIVAAVVLAVIAVFVFVEPFEEEPRTLGDHLERAAEAAQRIGEEAREGVREVADEIERAAPEN